MGNYSFKTTGLPEPVDGVVEGHNFAQGTPQTLIYAGQTGLTFRNCNLVNCRVPDDAVVAHCNRAQISFCSHLNPKWSADGRIATCVTECEHMVSKEIVTIDGATIDTVYVYADTRVT